MATDVAHERISMKKMFEESSGSRTTMNNIIDTLALSRKKNKNSKNHLPKLFFLLRALTAAQKKPMLRLNGDPMLR
jgi:RAB protein geranylgeranyltransferase component A